MLAGSLLTPFAVSAHACAARARQMDVRFRRKRARFPGIGAGFAEMPARRTGKRTLFIYKGSRRASDGSRDVCKRTRFC